MVVLKLCHFDSIIFDEYDRNLFISICRHKVVIVEGNYLLLDDGIWKEVSSMFDEKW